ncbi:hypothetical protein ACFFJY_05705 [Fictibacillus aquaticus]|uniref:hypothetical protein n=1 Tax=Fictibacillus aquaticus TaxID=2021314 RepID=UPI0013FE0D9F|nr:hypothetical protein [Fictibacillus aquaticus]
MMGLFIISMLPAFLLCGGVVMLIQSLVEKDTLSYDDVNLWEDHEYSPEDYRL